MIRLVAAAVEWWAVGRLVAVAAVKWKAVGRFVAAAVVPAAAASAFIAVPDCAACEVQNTKNNSKMDLIQHNATA